MSDAIKSETRKERLVIAVPIEVECYKCGEIWQPKTSPDVPKNCKNCQSTRVEKVGQTKKNSLFDPLGQVAELLYWYRNEIIADEVCEDCRSKITVKRTKTNEA